MTSEGRSVVFFCPYCGEEDLEPDGDAGGRYLCHSCTRLFVVEQVRSSAATS